MIKRIVLVAMLVLMAVPAHAGLFGDKFQDEVETEKVAVKLARDTIKGDYGLVTTAELKALVDANTDMVIVDAMPYADSYAKEHVPGAVQFLFPVKEMATWDTGETDGKTEADYEKLLGPDKDKLVVVYCGFVKCGRSHNAGLWARKLGYTNVKRYPGGIFAWKGADGAVESVK